MNILVVDDDNDIRAYLKQLLSEQGHTVREAENGQEGLARVREQRPDAIISDGLMPVMDGFQLLQALKSDSELAAIPFLFFSAVYTGQREQNLASALGADAFLVKPQSSEAIVNALHAAIAGLGKAARTATAPAGGDSVFAREYSMVVATALEEKVRQLERVTRDLERTKNELQKSEVVYRGLFENNPHPMWVYDLETLAFLAVNDAAINSYGFSREEFLAMTIKDIRRPEDAQKLISRVSIAADGFDAAGTWKHLKKDGTIIDVEIASHALEFMGKRAKLVLAHDVSEHTRLEKAVQHAAEEWRNTFDAMIEAVALLDAEGNILRCNKAMAALLGKHYKEIVGGRCWEIIYDMQGDLEDCPSVLARKTLRRETKELQLHDRWYEVTADPLLDGSGKFIGAAHIMTDITDRKRLEETLRVSEEKFRDFFELASDSVFIIDMTGKLIEVNRTGYERLGYTREEMLAKRVSELDPPEFASKVPERIAQIAKFGKAVFESAHIRKDGIIMPVEINARIIDYAGRKVVLSVIRDITERKNAEKSLREQQRFTESLIMGSAIATFVLDAGHRVLIWNKACEELTGVSAAELIGTNEQWRPFYDHKRPVLADLVLGQEPEKLSSLYDSFSLPTLTQEGLHAEGWFKNLNKRARYIVFDAAPIRDGNGIVIAAIETLQDITERKRAEESIQQSEERYRNLFENANDMIQSIAPDGSFIYVNPAWQKTMGYNDEDLRGLNMFDIMHPSCKTYCMAMFQKAMSGERIEHLEATFIAKDGRRVEIEGNASVRTIEGKVVATQGILRDVTERKKLEEQIYRSQQDWEYTFNSITDMVTVHDADYNIILANKAAEKILHLPILEKMKDKKCFAYYHGTDHAPAGCPSCGCLQTGVAATFEIFEPHLNLFIEIRAIPRFDSNNNLIGLIHVVRDITERKKAEESIERYNKQLTALNTASNKLMGTTSLADIYQQICDIIYSVFDIKMVWLGIVNASDVTVHPVAHAGQESGYLDAITVTWDGSVTGQGPTGQAIRSGKPVMARADDALMAPWRDEALKRGYQSFMAVPLQSKDGSCIGTLNFYGAENAFSSDSMRLTQIFANQAAVAIENAQLVAGLETKVLERTRALGDTNLELQTVNNELVLRREEAEAASRSKTDFLANMSHELRTPLNAIMGFSEIILMGMAGPVSDKQREFLGDIAKSGKHLLSLINDILDLSKVEAGKVELELGQVLISDLISGSFMMFKEKALKHSIKLESVIDPSVPDIVGDRRLLKQVLVNLLSNAFKFTPDGGSVTVAARRVQGLEELNIELRTLNSELDTELIEISVQDTGIGIDREHMLKLFKPFQQIDSSLTRKHAGTGLGLSLCRRFVELHGGRIWVESELGKGSTFYFVVPVSQEKVARGKWQVASSKGHVYPLVRAQGESHAGNSQTKNPDH